LEKLARFFGVRINLLVNANLDARMMREVEHEVHRLPQFCAILSVL